LEENLTWNYLYSTLQPEHGMPQYFRYCVDVGPRNAMNKKPKCIWILLIENARKNWKEVSFM
jgi:hypothetical protein